MAFGLSPVAIQHFLDDDGNPVPSGKLFTYQAGTLTPQAVYQDSSGTAHANPVELDANGRATIYLSGSSYKFVLKNAAETVTYWTQDNISNAALALETSTATLQNKTLDNTNVVTLEDASFTLQDESDNTKQARFQLTNISAGQTRTYSLPDSSTALAGVSSVTVIVPEEIEVVMHAQSAAAMVSQSFFVANQAYQVTKVRWVHAVAETTAVSLDVQLTKDTGTEAPGAGDLLLTNNSNAGFDSLATANTVQTGTLTATTADLQLAAGDRLSAKFEAAATELVGATMAVSLKRI